MGKYYVVWIGRKLGVYPTWAQCKEQVHKFPGARFKSFATQEIAKRKFNEGNEHLKGLRNNIPMRTILRGKKERKPKTIIDEMEILLDRVVTELRIYRIQHPR